MDNSKINKELGTKWFIFYTKVRSLLCCVFAVNLIIDFLKYTDTYLSNWWLLLVFFAGIAEAVLGIMVFLKSMGHYAKFVRFVKGVLLFETIYIPVNASIEQYIKTELGGATLISTSIWILICYFVWYRLNVNYFERRIIGGIYNKYACVNTFQESYTQNNIQKFNVYIFDLCTGKLRKEFIDIDTVKVPPSKFAVNDTYYAVETIKNDKKVRIYYKKNDWDKEIENGMSNEEIKK